MEYGSYEYYNIRGSAIPTTSYVSGTVLGPDIGTGLKNQLVLHVSFTKGSLTTAELKIEASHNGTDYYQETSSGVSGSTVTETPVEHQFSASGNYGILVPIKDNYIKVSVKGTGTVTGSLIKVDAVVGNV